MDKEDLVSNHRHSQTYGKRDVTSNVSDVSAILVEMITFLFPRGAWENTNSWENVKQVSLHSEITIIISIETNFWQVNPQMYF